MGRTVSGLSREKWNLSHLGNRRASDDEQRDFSKSNSPKGQVLFLLFHSTMTLLYIPETTSVYESSWKTKQHLLSRPLHIIQFCDFVLTTKLNVHLFFRIRSLIIYFIESRNLSKSHMKVLLLKSCLNGTFSCRILYVNSKENICICYSFPF